MCEAPLAPGAMDETERELVADWIERQGSGPAEGA